METDLRVLSDNEITQIHERTLSVLATMGLRVDTEKGRKLLKKAGAEVNPNTNVVRFPRELVENCLKLAPRNFALGGRRPNWELPMNANRCSLVADGGASFAIDEESGERREANFNDWRQATRMIDSLDEVGVYWSMVDPGFFQASVGGYTGYICETFRNFSKHVQDCTHSIEESRWLLEVLNALFGGSENLRKSKPFSYLVTPISPMVLEADHTDAYLEIAGRGIPLAIMPMPMMGGTAPASLISTLLVANCETLAMLCLAQAAEPGTPIIYAASPAIMDPYTGRFTGSEVEHGLMGAAVTEIARSYGLPVETSAGSTGHYQPGVRASYERALNWVMATLSWPDLLVGPGQLGGSLLLSLEQLLIDVEVFRRSSRLSGGIDTRVKEWLEVDLAAVGHGSNFLSRRSTREALRNGEVYMTDYDARKSYEAWSASGKPTMMEELRPKVQETLRLHTALPIDETIERELEKIQQHARSGIKI
ncbi:MAG: trimethylamine methyltransferase family protein [Anaerolineales bacterium]|nr:trimethylamine methyltransferase family protein [Anaerolineales bacterium]